MNLPSPTTFGLPSQYNKWRDHQSEACVSLVDLDPRFLLQVAPTGFGKSVVYMTASQLISGRTIILTSTKGLQSQLMNDFGSMDSVVDIRGRRNYPCRLNSKTTCDAGVCAFGVPCRMKEEGGCFYFDQLRKAKGAKVVITNYAYWMSQNEYSDGLRGFDLLILDEAHAAPDHVVSHISTTFSKRSWLEKGILQGQLPNDPIGWRLWARAQLVAVREDLEWAKTNRKEKRFLTLKRLIQKLRKLEERMDSTWVWEDTPESVTLSPIWPGPYAEVVLFLGIPKVVFTSATVVPKTAKLLGVPDRNLQVEEFPHSFPLESRPLTHLPTVRMNYRNNEMETRMWLSKIDQIIQGRVGTKGIIHTISYARRDLVLGSSRYASHMITHDRQNTESRVKTFKGASAPCILVSPAMATGWDFPNDECRWQIIVKLPYPDITGAIIRARMKRDEDFAAYLVMQQLIQATGRGVRSREDWCESFILDDNVVWFIDRNKHLSVNWFKGSYRVRRTVPEPIT